MTIELLTPDRYRKMPWKNGLGTTTEIARSPEGDGPFDWRVSVADVATGGPFSVFPGCDRHLVVIEGAGIRLEHPGLGRRATLRPLEPYAFDGDVETASELVDGPIRDFGLITRRGAVEGTLDVARGERLFGAAEPWRVAVVFALAGSWKIETGTGESEVGVGSTLLVTGDSARLRVVPEREGSIAMVARLRSLFAPTFPAPVPPPR